MKKKIPVIAILMLIILSASLVACDAKSDSVATPSAVNSSDAEDSGPVSFLPNPSSGTDTLSKSSIIRVFGDKEEDIKLSLSTTYDFSESTDRINLAATSYLDNCTLNNYLDEFLIDISDTNGCYKNEETKEYLLAGTFYLKNESDVALYYSESIAVECENKEAEKALRVILIKDYDPTDEMARGGIVAYAASQCDEAGNTIYDADSEAMREAVVPISRFSPSPYDPRTIECYEGFFFEEEDFSEEGEWLAKPFLDSEYVMKSDNYPFERNQIVKYTVLLYLEGNDKECDDAALGGIVSLSIKFNIGE